MRAEPVWVAALSTAMLAGCAGDWHRSYDRWYRYTAEAGPYGRWADCIEQRSGFYLDPRTPDGQGLRDDGVPGNRSQLFANVLADCREFMAGPGWNELNHDEIGQLVADAHHAFARADAEIQAHMDAAITHTGS